MRKKESLNRRPTRILIGVLFSAIVTSSASAASQVYMDSGWGIDGSVDQRGFLAGVCGTGSPYGSEYLNQIVETANKVLVTGYCWPSGQGVSFIYRLNSNGTLDSTFPIISREGYFDRIFLSKNQEWIYAQFNSQFLGHGIYRYSASGQLDTGFGNGGFLATGDTWASATAGSDGSIYVRANSFQRITAGGQIDSSFAYSGPVPTLVAGCANGHVYTVNVEGYSDTAPVFMTLREVDEHGNVMGTATIPFEGPSTNVGYVYCDSMSRLVVPYVLTSSDWRSVVHWQFRRYAGMTLDMSFGSGGIVNIANSWAGSDHDLGSPYLSFAPNADGSFALAVSPGSRSRNLRTKLAVMSVNGTVAPMEDWFDVPSKVQCELTNPDCALNPDQLGAGVDGRIYVLRSGRSWGSSNAYLTEISRLSVGPIVTVSSAPQKVRANGSDGQVVVAWDLPLEDGGAPIISFTASTNSGESCSVASPATSCSIVGLSNRHSYVVSVTATNRVGASQPSAPSAAVMPLAPGFQAWPNDTVLAVDSSTTLKVAQAAAAASIAVTGLAKATLTADSAGFASATFTATKAGIQKFTAAYSVKIGKKTTKYTATTQLYVPSLSGPMLKIKQGKTGKFSLQFMPPGAAVAIALSDGRTLTGTADSAGKATFAPTFNTLGAVTYTASVAGVQVGAGGLTITK